MGATKKAWRLTHTLRRFFLLDLLVDRRSRAVLIYAAITVVIGAIIYHYVEGWRWLDALYFVVITMTTIGYGDLTPQTNLGKVITIFAALNGIAILVMLLDQIRRLRGSELDDSG